MSAEKAALRLEIRAAIAALSERYIHDSDAGILKLLLSLPELNRGIVFTYCSMGRECDTRTLIDGVLNRGGSVALPVSRAGGAMDFIRHSGELKTGFLGISEPQNGEPLLPQAEDIMLVPALCCDTEGFRLGRGGGYYDRYLSEHACFSVCLCREQLLKKVPREWNDFPVRAVITEERLIRL